jgi:Zn-dependent protease with chaperone function
MMTALAESQRPENVEMVLDGEVHNLRTFPRISPAAFQHPDDKDASNALQAVPLLPELFKAINGAYLDQRIRMEHLTYNLRLGPSQGEKLYTRFLQAVRILDLPVIPELYLIMLPTPDAYSAGVSRPVVVLSYGCITQFDEAEVLAVISHELGHVKCRHGLNNSLATIFASAGVGGLAAMFPVVGPTATIAVRAALSHWCRMAEFSCDRAALLVVQDRDIVARMLSKLSGFHKGVVSDFNFESLYQQLEEYDRYDQNTFQSLVKLQKIVVDSLNQNLLHPSSILRIKRVLDWGQSDHFNDLMNGQYEYEDDAARSAGQELILQCSVCGAQLDKDSKFCSKCGLKVR